MTDRHPKPEGAPVAIPTLETARLILRAPGAADFDAYAEFCASDRSIPVGGPYDRIDAWNRFIGLLGHWQFHGYGRWIVTARPDPAPLGVVGLLYPEGWPEPEIAWSMFAAGEGKGYAFEAAQAARAYAYDTLGWTTVVSLIDPANTRSAALGNRMGAVQEGVHPHPKFGDLTIWRHPGPEVLA